MAKSSQVLNRVNISKDVSNVISAIVRYRRHFHRYPEIQFQEHKTAKFIEDELARFGLSPKRMVGTGVVALLDSAKKGKTIMLRADMDALPIKEENSHDYVSKHPGTMHACGHDAHMAILLGVAKILKRSGIPRGKVKFCFQPGEEGGDGAGKMVLAGVLKNPKVDFAFGMHVWSPLPVGEIAIIPGPVMASVDEFAVRILGSGGHAAYPHASVDPVVCACAIVLSLQTIVSRNVSPLSPAVLTVASIQAGTAFNIIPGEVVLKGTVRTFEKNVRKLIERRFREIIKDVASAYGCKAEIEFIHKVPATVNHPEMSQFVWEVAEGVVGKGNVKRVDPTMGGEDFSRYANEVPAVFAFIGARNEAKGAYFPHHHPRFDIDEDALPIGAELARQVTIKYLENFK